MKQTLLLFLTLYFTSAFQANAQTIQGSLKFGSNPKEVIFTIRNNSASSITGNLTKIMYTLHMNFGESYPPEDALKYLTISTVAQPNTGSFATSSFMNFLSNYLKTTWTGSLAVDLDPGEQMDVFKFSLTVSGNLVYVSPLSIVYEDPMYVDGRDWLVEVSGVNMTNDGSEKFYSTGPSVALYADQFGSSRAVRLTSFGEVNLPVKLSRFEANAEGVTSHLTWSTSEETNSDYFSIEHSRDAKHWTELGKMESQKESTVLNNYDFTHINAAPGINYYRLKMVDVDKTYAYSQIVKVNIDGKGGESIYPNPVLSKFELTNAGLKDVEKVRIFDVSGKLVHETSQVDESGISIGHLASGIFYVELEKAGGDTRKHKILKK